MIVGIAGMEGAANRARLTKYELLCFYLRASASICG